MAAPRFSIVTVTLNNPAGLQKTAESIGCQDCQDIEWIVIDGGSDEVGLAPLACNPPAILVREQDLGIYDAMNKGIAHASGDYTLFLNAGDALATPDVLSRIASVQADFIYGDSFEGGFYKPARAHERIKLGMFTHHQAMFYRTDLLKTLRFSLSYPIAADYDLTIRFLEKAKDVHHLACPLCLYETGGVSQIKAAQGRREQFDIRKENQVCGGLENRAIMFAQKALWFIRCSMPRLYWLWKGTKAKAARSPA